VRKFIVLIAVIGTAAAIYIASHQGGANLGTNVAPNDHPPAPDFSLTDLSGQKLTLSSFKGKVVLLDFWATWCDPCRAEIPRFIEFQNKYGSKGFQIVGISMDDSEQPVREFYQKFHMNYAVALADSSTPRNYGGIFGLPVAILIGRDGRIYGKYIGEISPDVFEKQIQKLL
jgi:cytochrome c biogenesis protein CcmG/thiol:disulfide interchange protein DsbE